MQHTIKLGTATDESDGEGQVSGCCVNNARAKMKLKPTVLDRKTITFWRRNYFSETSLFQKYRCTILKMKLLLFCCMTGTAKKGLYKTKLLHIILIAPSLSDSVTVFLLYIMALSILGHICDIVVSYLIKLCGDAGSKSARI